jgi:hypothetical protein
MGSTTVYAYCSLQGVVRFSAAPCSPSAMLFRMSEYSPQISVVYSSVGIATAEIRLPAEVRGLFLHLSVHTGSEAHPVF